MKIIFSLSFFFCLLTVVSFSYAQSTGEQTEEYAILNVFQEGRKNYITTTIGSQPTEEKEYPSGKVTQLYDMTLVVAKMHELNKMGYTLFSSSTAIVALANGTSGVPFYTFIFVKEK